MQSTQQCSVTAEAVWFEAVDAVGTVIDGVSIGRTADAGTIVLASTTGGAVELCGVKGPTGPYSADNKQYVDALVSGVRWLDPVTVATNDTVGAYTLEVNDRVLVRCQTDPVQNGVYVVQSEGGPVRAADLTSSTSAAGAAVFVQVGQFASCGFVCSVSDPDSATVGTDSLAFVQFTGLGQFIGGAGIDLNGSTIAIKPQGVTTNLIQDEAVTEGKLAERSVVASKIGPLAVETGKIQDGAVDGTKLGVLVVGTSHLVDYAITHQKMALGAVTRDKILDGAVNAAKIEDSVVNAAKLALGAVTRDKILDGAVNAAKIEDSAVNAAKLALGAVTRDKILDGAVNAPKIEDSAVNVFQLFSSCFSVP
jgi:hypothetical protein